MKYTFYPVRILFLLILVSIIFLHRTAENYLPKIKFATQQNEEREEGEEDEEEEESNYTRQRAMHEFEMLRNPSTGTIPRNIHEIELEVARNIPEKHFIVDYRLSQAASREAALVANTYVSAGPDNIAGRSRTLAFDSRNKQIMLSGGVTGGIFRSVDGGQNWTFVSPQDDIRSVSSIVQDPTNRNTWYCGTGEVYTPTSEQETAVPGTVGHGIFKSTDNGASWSKLAATADSDPNTFNGSFDLVHRLAVHPTTGHVYAAVHNRIMRSTNGGQTWQTVLNGNSSPGASAGMTEIFINPAGTKIYAGFSGDNPDAAIVGVWESTTGDALTSTNNSWVRIAGAAPGQAGYVPGWRPHRQWGRIVLTVSPANQLYALYNNKTTASSFSPFPEADLFRCNVSSGNPASYTWENLNSYVPNEPVGFIEGINPYTVQFNGFNMSINVKPGDENVLFIGGTVLERVMLNETDPALKFKRIGGYALGFLPNEFYYPNHHPDIHGIYFPPGGTAEMYTASDGGIHRTLNNMASVVTWESLNKGFQTVQYQFVNIIPDINYDWIIGGTQDNGTLVNLNNIPGKEHQQTSTGDGAASAMSGFYKSGNTWTQYMYQTIVNGTIIRGNFSWNYNGSPSLSFNNSSFTNITPNGESNNGQWITLLILDPDSTENLFYNTVNRLYRTTHASTVNSSTWTPMTGVSSVVPSNTNLTSLALSRSGSKILYFGTNAGKVYRLRNPANANPGTAPEDITPPTMFDSSYVSGISVNPRNPDTVMAVVSNYDIPGRAIVQNIFWTGNATAAKPTWQVIDGALGSLSIQSCAIVVKPTGVEYYVGTSVGLYNATAVNSSGTVWTKEGNGMMRNAIIRSLYNRPQDNKLVVGTHGNGAFIGAVNLVVTGTNEPGLNDKNFIAVAYPTLSSGDLFFRAGNLPLISQINCKVFAMNGQQLYETNLPYANGVLHLQRLAAGNYILVISALNNKYRFVTRFNKYN